jgi:hypothetical protein
MNPGLDPLDPLELALLMEAAEDLGDLDRDDPLAGEVVPEDGGQDAAESWDAVASALHQADSACL